MSSQHTCKFWHVEVFCVIVCDENHSNLTVGFMPSTHQVAAYIHEGVSKTEDLGSDAQTCHYSCIIQAFMCVDGKRSVGYCNSFHYSWFISNFDFALDLHLD
jgi:hypothetical protein